MFLSHSHTVTLLKITRRASIFQELQDPVVGHEALIVVLQQGNLFFIIRRLKRLFALDRVRGSDARYDRAHSHIDVDDFLCPLLRMVGVHCYYLVCVLRRGRIALLSLESIGDQV